MIYQKKLISINIIIIKGNTIAKKGKEKYFRLFNNRIISDYICAKIFESKTKSSFLG